MNLVITSAPAAEPLALDDVKAHLRITHDADDDALNALIRAAREIAENYTGLALITRGCSLYLDLFESDMLELPMPPLQEVTALNVYDAEGDAAEFPAASYTVDATSKPARLLLTSAAPTPGQVLSGIEIAFTAGFGDSPDDVPSSLKEGMKRLVAHLYLNRGDSTETALRNSGAQHLFQPWRVMRVK